MADGTVKRRRRRQPEAAPDAEEQEVAAVAEISGERPKRECPVPKPGGLVGKVMGFEQRAAERRAEVVVKGLAERRVLRRRDGGEAEGA